MAFDPELIAALHPRVVAGAELERGGPAQAAFQAATIDALLHGRYEGDLGIATLLRHGDLGLGTVDHLDGELIVVDGEAWSARVDGSLRRVPGDERTPFAVVTPFRADVEVAVQEPLEHDALLALIDRNARDAAHAVRVDGVLDVHARSVPRQEPPYRPLAEIVQEQQVCSTCPALRGPWWASASPPWPRGSRCRGTTCTRSPPTGAPGATSFAAGCGTAPCASAPSPTSTSSFHQGSSFRPASRTPTWKPSSIRVDAIDEP